MATVSVGSTAAHQGVRPALFSDAHALSGEENLSGRSENFGQRNLGLRGTSLPAAPTLENAPSGNSSGSTAIAGNLYRTNLTDATYGMPSSSESLRYVPVSRGVMAGVPEPTKRQLEALEDRLGASITALCRQQTADRQEADRLADLSSGRLVARVDRSEQQQARLERRISELAGLIKGFDDEAQTRETRSEQLHERVRSLQATLKQEQDSLQKRLCDLEQDQKAVAASSQTAAHANEDSQRHNAQRMRQVEMQVEEHSRTLDALGREAHTLHERIDGFQSSNRNAEASLGVTCDQDLAETIQGHAFPTASRKVEDWSPRVRAAGEEAFLAMQEIEAVHQQLQALQDRCSFVQEVVDERLTSQLKRLERKVGDHEMKVDQLLTDGQDCSSKVEEHEVRLGVTRSKLDAHDQRLALINDRLDRVLKLERASIATELPGSRSSLPNEESRCRELRELRDRVETSLVTITEKTSPAFHEMRELRGRVESCEQQLSSSALASTCNLGSSNESGAALRGSLPLPPALERRMLTWESTLSELSDRFEQQYSALVHDGSLAERALEQADAATIGLADLASKINKLAKLGEVSSRDVSGHLEVVTEQFGQLRERVQKHEEHLVSSNGAKLRPEELARIQEQTDQNAKMISTLSRSIVIVPEMLSEVKKTLDLAVARRGASTENNAAATRHVASEQPALHISQEFISRTEECAGKALERAREAEQRTYEIERVVSNLQVTLDARVIDDVKSQITRLTGKINTLESQYSTMATAARLADTNTISSETPRKSNSDEIQARIVEDIRGEVIDLARKLDTWASQWSSLITAAGLGVETNPMAFENLGKLLHALPEHRRESENQASVVAIMQGEMTSLSAQLEALNAKWISMVTSAGLDDTNIAAFESLGKSLRSLPEIVCRDTVHDNQMAVEGVKSEVVSLAGKVDTWTKQWSCLTAAAGLGDETNAAAFESLGKLLHTLPDLMNHDKEDQATIAADVKSEVVGLNSKLKALETQWSSLILSAGFGDSVNASACEQFGKLLHALPVIEKQVESTCIDLKNRDKNFLDHENSLQRIDAAIDEIFARLNSREAEQSDQHLTRLEQLERSLEEQRNISQSLEQRFEQGSEVARGHASLNRVHPPEVGGGGHNRSFVMQGEVAGGGPVSHVTPPIVVATRPTNNQPAEAEMSAGLYGMTRRAETEAETSAGPFPSPAQAHRFQADPPPQQAGEDELTESHVTGGDGAGGASPSHPPTTPLNRNPIPQVGLFAEGDGAGGPNAISTRESTLAEADGGGGRGIWGSSSTTDVILGGNGDEGGGNEGRNDVNSVESHTGDRNFQDTDGPRTSLGQNTHVSAEADLDMLFEDLTGAEMAGGGPGRHITPATAPSGSDFITNVVSSQASSSDSPSRWNQVLEGIQSRMQPSPSKLDIEEFQSPASNASSKSQFTLEATALARWKRFTGALLENGQTDEPVVESPNSLRSPARKPSRNFALSGPAVSQRGDLLMDPEDVAENVRPGSWPSFRSSGLPPKEQASESLTSSRKEKECEDEENIELIQDCSPESIQDKSDTEWVIDSGENSGHVHGIDVESLHESSLDGKSQGEEDQSDDIVVEMHGAQHEQQGGANATNSSLAHSSPSALGTANVRSSACEDTTITSLALDESQDPLAHLGIGDSDDGASNDSIVEDIDEELLEDSSEVPTLKPQAPNPISDDIAAVDLDDDSSDDAQVENQRDPVARGPSSFDAVTAGIASTYPELVIDTLDDDESAPARGSSFQPSTCHTGAVSSQSEVVTTEIVEAASPFIKGGMRDAFEEDSEESDEGDSSEGFV